jgi:glycosyltransferase involved in cell wall biosynthesis
MTITIIVPIYNEVKSLPILLSLIDQTNSQNIHFLIVDNGSTDLDVPKLLLRHSDKWTAIRTDKNLGFGGGILFGVKSVKSGVVGWMPGNLKIDPQDVVNLLRNFQLGEGEILKAKRIGRSFLQQVKTFIAGLLQSVILKKQMFDSGGTPTICRKKFIIELRNPPLDYVFESFVLYQARKLKLKVIRPKIYYGKRLHGQSHWQRGIRSEILLMKRIWMAARGWKS